MASGYAGKPVRIRKVRTRFVSIPGAKITPDSGWMRDTSLPRR